MVVLESNIFLVIVKLLLVVIIVDDLILCPALNQTEYLESIP